MNHILVCLVKGPAEIHHQKLVRELTEKFDVHYLSDYGVPTHITLKHEFDISHVHAVEQVLEKFCAVRRATPVKIKGYGRFSNESMYMAAEFSHEARQQHHELLESLKTIEDLEWSDDPEVPRYHCSLAYFDIHKKIDAMMEFVEEFPCEYDIQFDNIAILANGKVGWVLKRLFELK